MMTEPIIYRDLLRALRAPRLHPLPLSASIASCLSRSSLSSLWGIHGSSSHTGAVRDVVIHVAV